MISSNESENGIRKGEIYLAHVVSQYSKPDNGVLTSDLSSSSVEPGTYDCKPLLFDREDLFVNPESKLPQDIVDALLDCNDGVFDTEDLKDGSAWNEEASACSAAILSRILPISRASGAPCEMTASPPRRWYEVSMTGQARRRNAASVQAMDSAAAADSVDDGTVTYQRYPRLRGLVWTACAFSRWETARRSSSMSAALASEQGPLVAASVSATGCSGVVVAAGWLGGNG